MEPRSRTDDTSRSGTYAQCKHLCGEPDDFYTIISIVLMFSGVVCMVVGYVVPRDYKFNPFTPAREMEEIEIYFATLSHRLNLVITVGMGLVAAGGVIMTGVMFYTLYCKPECTQDNYKYQDLDKTNYEIPSRITRKSSSSTKHSRKASSIKLTETYKTASQQRLYGSSGKTTTYIK